MIRCEELLAEHLSQPLPIQRLSKRIGVGAEPCSRDRLFGPPPDPRPNSLRSVSARLCGGHVVDKASTRSSPTLPLKDRKFADSPLEGAGSELPVPGLRGGKRMCWRSTEECRARRNVFAGYLPRVRRRPAFLDYSARFGKEGEREPTPLATYSLNRTPGPPLRVSPVSKKITPALSKAR